MKQKLISKYLFVCLASMVSFSSAMSSETVEVIFTNPQKQISHLQMPLEEYVAGILEGELGNSFHLETLKAQAVISRSWTYKNLYRHTQQFQFCSLTHCQVWRKPSFRSRLAAWETSGQILTPSPEFIFFASSCARKIDLKDAQHYWCERAPDYFWKLKLSKTAFEKIFELNSILEIKDLGDKLSARSSQRSLILSKEEFFEKAVLKLGNQVVRSPFFKIVAVGPEWILMGKGLGHGRGFCQWAAEARAEKKWSMPSILKIYFPAIGLTPKNNLSLLQKIAVELSKKIFNVQNQDERILLPFDAQGYFITFKNSQGKTLGCSGELRHLTEIHSNEFTKHILRATQFDPRYPKISSKSLESCSVYFSFIQSVQEQKNISDGDAAHFGWVYEAQGKKSILLPGEAKTSRWALLELRRQAGFDRIQADEKLWQVKTRVLIFPADNPWIVREY